MPGKCRPCRLGGKGEIVIIVSNNDYTIENVGFATSWFSLTDPDADAIMEENNIPKKKGRIS